MTGNSSIVQDLFSSVYFPYTESGVLRPGEELPAIDRVPRSTVKSVSVTLRTSGICYVLIASYGLTVRFCVASKYFGLGAARDN